MVVRWARCANKLTLHRFCPFLRRHISRLISNVGSEFLCAAVGLITLFVVIALTSQPGGVHLKCECEDEIRTGVREMRYLRSLMNEVNPLNNRTAKSLIPEQHPSLAIDFLVRHELRGKRCSLLPGLFSIHHRNSIWQEAVVGSTTFLIYGAYYDDRDSSEGPLIRILAVVDSTWPPKPTCHIYADEDEVPTATRATRLDYVHWQEAVSGQWLPYIITCHVEKDLLRIPSVVSLVSHPCMESTNAIRVINSLVPQSKLKKNLALCHKFLFNPSIDLSFRLTEWIETALAWGVDDIIMYKMEVHPNMMKVLQFYEELGVLSLMPWTNPGTQPNIPSLHRSLYDTQRYTLFTMENIPYTDCLLRHITTHRYVGVWDIDEMIIPTLHSSLPDMVDAARKRWINAHTNLPDATPPTSYVARCSYFFDDKVESTKMSVINDHNFTRPQNKEHAKDSLNKKDEEKAIPHYLHLMTHVTRTMKFTPPAVFTKSIHDTTRALGLHGHFALINLEGAINRMQDLYHLYPASEGFLGHYRSKCQGEDQNVCESVFRPYLVRDETLWKHKEQVILNVQRTLRKLRIIS